MAAREGDTQKRKDMEYSSSSVSCNLQPGVIYHIFNSLLKSTVVTESFTFRLLAFPTVSITGLSDLYIWPKHGPEESNKLFPKLKDTVPILRTNSADCYSRAQCSSQEICKHQFLKATRRHILHTVAVKKTMAQVARGFSSFELPFWGHSSQETNKQTKNHRKNAN